MIYTPAIPIHNTLVNKILIKPALCCVVYLKNVFAFIKNSITFTLSNTKSGTERYIDSNNTMATIQSYVSLDGNQGTNKQTFMASLRGVSTTGHKHSYMAGITIGQDMIIFSGYKHLGFKSYNHALNHAIEFAKKHNIEFNINAGI